MLLRALIRRRTFGPVEVRLVLLVELVALFELFAAFDHDGALVRLWLALVEFVAFCTRPWLLRAWFAAAHAVLLRLSCNTGLLCQLRLLLLDERFARELDAIALEGKHLYHHLVAFT